MALIEFQNNIAPYLNAENLNNNFNYLENKFNTVVELGSTDNEEKTIILNNDSLSNYKFICVVSGYGYYKCSTTIPVTLFKNFNNSYNQCMQYVKTYNSNAYTSINYIDDTSFKINGQVGTDVITTVYGIK